MGWTSYHATHYKWVGKGYKRTYTVDKKAECDYHWEGGLNSGHFKIIKSIMIGSTYYAAIKSLKKCIGKNEKGEYQYIDIPSSEQETFAVIFLFSSLNSSAFVFNLTLFPLKYPATSSSPASFK